VTKDFRGTSQPSTLKKGPSLSVPRTGTYSLFQKGKVKPLRKAPIGMRSVGGMIDHIKGKSLFRTKGKGKASLFHWGSLKTEGEWGISSPGSTWGGRRFSAEKRIVFFGG